MKRKKSTALAPSTAGVLADADIATSTNLDALKKTAKVARAKAGAIERVFGKRSEHYHVMATEWVRAIKCDRRLGEICGPPEKGRPRKSNTEIHFSLEKAGVSRVQVQRWRALALVHQDDFDEYVQETKSQLGDLSVRGLMAKARLAKRAETAERIAMEPMPLPGGPYRVIVADPPWPYDKRAEDRTHRGALPYPPMPITEICALDIGARAHEEGCILWLWTTNAFMRDAYTVLDNWGFEEKTILTWVKNKIGLGDWLRGKTEHCILAVRGKPIVTLTNQSTALHAEAREHSRKPDAFYELVEALCPGSKLELFSRTPRPGWHAWGAETEEFLAAE